MIWIIIWSEYLKNLAINNKIPIILTTFFFILIVEKIFWYSHIQSFRFYCEKRCADNCPKGKMPPDLCPRTIAHWMVAPHIITSRTIAPENNCHPNNCPRGKLPPWMIAPGLLLPGNYPKDNCPQGKLFFKWFVAYIIAPWTNGPEENCPPGKLSQV